MTGFIVEPGHESITNASYCQARSAFTTLAVVTTWPVWRWEWSATWMSAPPMEVGNCFPAHAAKGLEVGRSQHAYAIRRIAERNLDLGQEHCQRLFARLFRFQGRQLLRRELIAFRIAKQAVSRARNMAQMEGNRGQPERLGVYLGIGQALSPFGQIVEGQVESVENGAAHRRNVGVGSAQPGLDVGG